MHSFTANGNDQFTMWIQRRPTQNLQDFTCNKLEWKLVNKEICSFYSNEFCKVQQWQDNKSEAS